MASPRPLCPLVRSSVEIRCGELLRTTSTLAVRLSAELERIKIVRPWHVQSLRVSTKTALFIRSRKNQRLYFTLIRHKLDQ